MSYFYSTDGICYLNEHFSIVNVDTSASVDAAANIASASVCFYSC